MSFLCLCVFSFYFNWRLITLQYCSGFCHTLTWIRCGCTCVPHPEPLSYLPPHTIPLGHPSAPAPSILYHALNLDWWLVSCMIIYMFQCHSPKSSHPCLLPKSPKDCPIHLCLACCLTYRVIITIFLNCTCISILYSEKAMAPHSSTLAWKSPLLLCWWECKLVQPLWRTEWRFLKKTGNNCHMTQQSHCWAYTLGKPKLKEARVPQCSSQHCL